MTRYLHPILLPLLLTTMLQIHATDASAAGAAVTELTSGDPPDLVIGIVVDQMRYDYIHRYWDDYGEGGIKRLYSEGFSFDNARFNYVPTYTAPGHASVFTGTTPAVHGIIGNSWYDRQAGRTRYNVEDETVEPVGTDGDAGRMSPKRMLTTTITDELRLHTNMRSRVVSVALKDRSSILTAGHTGNGAYWFDEENGNFVTSSFYRDELPGWVRDFNRSGRAESYMEGTWDLLQPEDRYQASLPDDNPYEGTLPGGDKNTFPYDLEKKQEAAGYSLLPSIPAGNTFTLDFALQAIEAEQLGQRGVTDFLAIGFSTPDIIGHTFGPASREVHDQYLRFDREIERLLDYIDEQFGRENVLIFLTSDHGAAHVPRYMQDQQVPAGYFHDDQVEERIRTFLQQTFGEDLLSAFSNQQVFLDRQAIDDRGLDRAEVQTAVSRYLRREEGVAGTLTAETLINTGFTEGPRALVQRGFHQQRSGDVVAWLESQWVPFWEDETGTTHFSPWSYDTRAPMIWYGSEVQPGSTSQRVSVTDIAPTLSILLGIPFPSGTTGDPLDEWLR